MKTILLETPPVELHRIEQLTLAMPQAHFEVTPVMVESARDTTTFVAEAVAPSLGPLADVGFLGLVIAAKPVPEVQPILTVVPLQVVFVAHAPIDVQKVVNPLALYNNAVFAHHLAHTMLHIVFELSNVHITIRVVLAADALAFAVNKIAVVK